MLCVVSPIFPIVGFGLLGFFVLVASGLSGEIYLPMQHPSSLLTGAMPVSVHIGDVFWSRRQISRVGEKALRMLGVINRNVVYKSAEVITKLYCAFVRPHLEYCVQAWCPIYEKDSCLLERVQKRATKMVNGLSSLEYEERLKTLDSLSDRI